MTAEAAKSTEAAESTQRARQSDQPIALPAAIAVCGGLVAAIVLGTLVIEGVAAATRAVTSLVMPLGTLWLFLLGSATAFGCRGNRLIGGCFTFAFGLLTLTGNPVVSSLAIKQLEWPETPLTASAGRPFRSVIVLGGGISVTPGGKAEVNRDGQRIVAAAQLWHQGLTRSIICTGESPSGLHHPADVGQNLLVSLGVPKNVIYKVGGENTSREMKQLQSFFRNLPDDFPAVDDPAREPAGNPVGNTGKQMAGVGLITSAFHLPRAVRLSRSSGLAGQIELEPIPTCFRQMTLDCISPQLLIPSGDSAGDLARVLKERLARVVGR